MKLNRPKFKSQCDSLLCLYNTILVCLIIVLVVMHACMHVKAVALQPCPWHQAQSKIINTAH